MTATIEPATPTDAIAIVTNFAELVRHGDPAAIELCDENIVYINQPFTFSRTRIAGLRWVAGFLLLPGGFELRIENIAADGSTVLTERTDIYRIGPLEVHIWACGTHVLKDGKIVLWHDRFDYLDAAAAIPRGLLNLVRGRRV